MVAFRQNARRGRQRVRASGWWGGSLEALPLAETKNTRFRATCVLEIVVHYTIIVVAYCSICGFILFNRRYFLRKPETKNIPDTNKNGTAPICLPWLIWQNCARGRIAQYSDGCFPSRAAPCLSWVSHGNELYRRLHPLHKLVVRIAFCDSHTYMQHGGSYRAARPYSIVVWYTARRKSATTMLWKY